MPWSYLRILRISEIFNMDVPLEELQRERLEADIRLRILETEATLRQEIIRKLQTACKPFTSYRHCAGQYTFYNPRLYTNFDVILSTKDDKPVACIVQVENDCPSSWRCVREAYSNGTEFHLEALETLLSLVRGEGGQPQCEYTLDETKDNAHTHQIKCSMVAYPRLNIRRFRRFKRKQLLRKARSRRNSGNGSSQSGGRNS